MSIGFASDFRHTIRTVISRAQLNADTIRFTVLPAGRFAGRSGSSIQMHRPEERCREHPVGAVSDGIKTGLGARRNTRAGTHRCTAAHARGKTPTGCRGHAIAFQDGRNKRNFEHLFLSNQVKHGYFDPALQFRERTGEGHSRQELADTDHRPPASAGCLGGCRMQGKIEA